MSISVLLFNANKPPSASVMSAWACSNTAAPPVLQRGRNGHPAMQRRSWHSGCVPVLRPSRAGCWRWKRLRRAQKEPRTHPPRRHQVAATGSAPGTCSGGGRWRCFPACPLWWWGHAGHTGRRCCGRRLKS